MFYIIGPGTGLIKLFREGLSYINICENGVEIALKIDCLIALDKYATNV
jgi:hypothetical protein